MGPDFRRQRRGTGGPHSLFAYLQPIFHGLRRSFVLRLPAAAQDRITVSIGPYTSDTSNARHIHRPVPRSRIYGRAGLHHVTDWSLQALFSSILERISGAVRAGVAGLWR